jgi:hypothetical protein
LQDFGIQAFFRSEREAAWRFVERFLRTYDRNRLRANGTELSRRGLWQDSLQ